MGDKPNGATHILKSADGSWSYVKMRKHFLYTRSWGGWVNEEVSPRWIAQQIREGKLIPISNLKVKIL